MDRVSWSLSLQISQTSKLPKARGHGVILQLFIRLFTNDYISCQNKRTPHFEFIDIIVKPTPNLLIKETSASMSKYQQILLDLSDSFSQHKWKTLLDEIRSRGQHISKQEAGPLTSTSLTGFLRQKCLHPPAEDWFGRLNELIKLMYSTNSPCLPIFYRILPILSIKLIQSHSCQEGSSNPWSAGFEDCLISMYNNEYTKYNETKRQKSQPSKNINIRDLYSRHMLRQIAEYDFNNLRNVDELDSTTKDHIKNVLFYVIYREISHYGPESLHDYYHSIFIYCGTDQQSLMPAQQSKIRGSLAILEGKNQTSIFMYGITQEELEWIILTLYELSIRVKKDKYQLLATISLVHKKVSNECQFKMSEVAQSLLHLLEDEYSTVFG